MPDAFSSLDWIGWETVAIAALVAVVCVLAVRRPYASWRGAVLRLVIVALAIVATFGYFELSQERDRTAERRAVATRQADLAIRALAPGSPLACLDGDAGEAVETACEQAIFARPDTVAAAVVYMTAKLSLLADADRLVGLDDEEFAASLAGLRRALALDRYGIAAHVLATREGCNAESCRAFAWFADPTALKANLKAAAFDGYVARHAADWNKQPEAAPEPAKPPSPADVPQASAAPPGTAPSFAGRYDFPSAASIPPVSIMNKEPPRPPEGNVAAAPSAPSATPPAQPGAPEAMPMPPKRPQTQGSEPR
jgi:hypothetical protein